ncbi:AAA family ATPase [Puniceibacterium sediminis]|uniref:AAA ATPase domain-containing protein n=1 Tax=Puniceibacterium sediminis TaxID=1608407 RepID=A0A238XZL3_9RHOB|nr:DUF3696 domain-containing protein [Puniceibacterium sediminis]SNR64425.1 AAA ATPase domain-containing protein [Puniceibacterium sediminis]
MLRKWSLKNFKSYRDLDKLELSSINVLAGANSSGKSTIIQSILLLKQTLQYGSPDRPVALNGPLLRMGAFSDIRNNASVGEAVGFKFEFDVSEDSNFDESHSTWYRALNSARFSKENSEIQKISAEFSLLDDVEGVEDPPVFKSSNPIMPKFKMSVTSNINEVTRDATVELIRHDATGMDNIEHQGFEYSVRLDKESEAFLFEDLPKAAIAGAFTSSFLPSLMGVRYDAGEKEAKDIVKNLFNPRQSLLSRSSAVSPEDLPPKVIELIREWLDLGSQEQGLFPIGSEPNGDVVEQMQKAVRNSERKRVHRTSLRNVLSSDDAPDPWETASLLELKDDVLRALSNEMGGKRSLVGREPKDIERSSEFLRRFFQEGVRYLGPLRDSPRPVYQPEALESETDVGYRGEHTAAVLDINRRRLVFYHRPPVENLEDDYANVATQHYAQLHEAVVEWLVYLGVADDVVTTDAGVYGNRLQVSTDNQGHLHDLTNVGVGVSQVLPIVVMALLAPKGSLLIFEQPELHLHPKVQARLADLFLALALDGKQMILETHSEYLIDRFRLRVALSDTDSVRPLVNILFSEKANGQSDLTSIDLNEFGGVLKWPKDFFEQSQKDVSRILRATAKRRKNKLKNS